MTTPQPPQEVRLELNLPPEQEAGIYASFASIWRDNDGFILDFAVATLAPRQATDETTGRPFVSVPSKIVSRVRIPASQAWEFVKGLTSQLEQWEQEHGRLTPPPDESRGSKS